MNKAQLKQKILDALNKMSEGERVEIYNDGCVHFNYTDGMAFSMNGFDELEGNRPFSEIYRNLTDNFNFDDDYYYLDGYGHYRSFSNIMDSFCAYVFDDLIDSAIDDKYDFGNPKIAEVFEEVRSEEK